MDEAYTACCAGYESLLNMMRGRDSYFLALAPHSVNALNVVLQKLDWEGSARLFVPVFPIDTGLPKDTVRAGFVLQGLLQEQR